MVPCGGRADRCEPGGLGEEFAYKKLGKWVLVEVTEALDRERLGCFPEGTLGLRYNTAPRQAWRVWIYENDGGTRARIINAVLHPEQRDVRAAPDALADHGEVLTPE